MIETEIEAAINQLRADTMPFLDVQRQRLLARHQAVEHQSKEPAAKTGVDGTRRARRLFS